MAEIIEDCITIRVSKLVKNGFDGSSFLVDEEKLPLIEATLEEVLELPDGTVVEVSRDAG